MTNSKSGQSKHTTASNAEPTAQRVRVRFPATRWGAVLLVLLLWFIPVPLLTPVQRHLLATFAATIVALIARPAPMGACVLAFIALLGLTRTVPANRLFTGYANPTVWLVFIAFLFARAVSLTRFGLRVAYVIIRRFGKSPLTLGYSVAASDLVLAPFIPSDTARGGGLVGPVTRSLAEALGSYPGTTSGRAGAYLILVAFHTTYLTSAMFLTGMAANPLIAEFARNVAHVEISWAGWMTSAIVPGMVSFALVPYVIYRVSPPELQIMEPARLLASDELRTLGPMRGNERRLVAILLLTMLGWITSPWHGISNTVIALAAVAAILLSRVISWNDLLTETTAWDTLIWFGALVTLAERLDDGGTIKALTTPIIGRMHGLPWISALLAIVLAYVYVHYAFASMTAHVTALYPIFLTAALATGAPGMLAALLLAFFSNLNAAMTHYGTGSAPVFFGMGYVDLGKWWRIGFLVSLINLVVWLTVGMLWWKMLHLW